MKKYLIILFLIVFIVPSITLASWWNPISWFRKSPKTVEQTTAQVSPVQTEKQKTPEEKISDLQKQLDELKKQQSFPVSVTTTPVAKKEVKKDTTIVTNSITSKPVVAKKVVDICNEIEGVQSIVPLGYVKYGSGPCVLNIDATTAVNKSDLAVKEPIRVGLFFMKSSKSVSGNINTYSYPLTLTNKGNEPVFINGIDMNITPQGNTEVIKVSVVVGDIITSKESYNNGSDTRNITINLGNSFTLQPFQTNTLMIKISGENIPTNLLTIQNLGITGNTPVVFATPISTL